MNNSGLERVSELCDLYNFRWGKEVDMLALPSGIDIVKTLERIVDTGESPIVGWQKKMKKRGISKMRNYICLESRKGYAEASSKLEKGCA